METTKAAYLAGLVDGEGSIMLRVLQSRASMSFQPQVLISNTNKEVLETVKKWFGLGTIRTSKSTRGFKVSYIWSVQSHKDVQAVLEVILPYLIIKKEHGTLLLKYVRDHQTRQGKWWQDDINRTAPDWEVLLANHLMQLNQRSTKILQPRPPNILKPKKGICKGCGHFFEYRIPAQRYCSPNCKIEATRQRERQRNKLRYYIPAAQRVDPKVRYQRKGAGH